MEINKEQIKRNLIKSLCDRGLCYQIEESDMEKLNSLIDDLCDFSKKEFFKLNDRQTLILRLRLGVFNDGQVQTYETIGRHIGRTSELVRQILFKAYRIVYNYRIKEDLSLPTSSEIQCEEVLEMPIESLNITARTLNCLRRARIETIGEIVKLNSDDLIKTRNCGPKSQEELVEAIHSLGLHFADEIEISKDGRGTVSRKLKQKQEELVSRYNALTSEKAALEVRSQQLDAEINEVMEQINEMNKGVINGQTK